LLANSSKPASGLRAEISRILFNFVEVVMELHLHWHHWRRRDPDWTAAAVSGFAAGAILMVLELIWATLVNTDGPWRLSHLVAALTMGPGLALQEPASGFDAGIVAMALATHYGLGVGFGMALGFVIAGFHFEASAPAMLIIGAVFGLVLYGINFYAVTTVFPWFAELRGWDTLITHLVFGLSAALLYWKLARRSAELPPQS
jgi:hypothetical protein